MGVCGDLSSDEMTIVEEGTAFSAMTKSQIKHNSFPDSPPIDDKEKLLGTPTTKDIAGGTAFCTMTKSQRASSQIKHNSSSDSPLIDDKESIFGTLSTKEIAGFYKIFPQSPLSSAVLSIQTEESMSSFDWAENGFGFDGLERNTDKTREEIGMEALKAMEACGADVKRLSTHGGRTSLMFAVLSKDLRFVKQLVALRADVLKENDEGETALTLAKSLSTHDIYRFLQNVSADLY